MTEPYELPQRPKTGDWIDRVRAADGDAEACWQIMLTDGEHQPPEQIQAAALLSIAAELRAARIARRPGAGQ